MWWCRRTGKDIRQVASWQWPLLVFVIIVYYFFSIFYREPSVFNTTADVISYHGYGAETHEVITEDGYLLEVHRILRRRHHQGNKTIDAPPVVFQHGFSATSSCWVFLGPQRDLAFLLAEAGFDVWLLNARGSSYTRALSTATASPNDFSFQEVGAYDIPAAIDYVLNSTGFEKVTYIGHSMGTTAFFAGLSMRPEYNGKVNHMFALAPLTNRKEFTHFGHRVMEIWYALLGKTGHEIADFIGFFRKGFMRVISAEHVIKYLPIFVKDIILNMVVKGVGGASKHYIQVPLEVVYAHMPDATTYNSMSHLYRNINLGGFYMRDYGKARNTKKYGSHHTPLYNLTNVHVPITAYIGTADTVTPYQDFAKDAGKFGTKVKMKILPDFNHFDLIWNDQATTSIYNDVLKRLKRSSKHYYNIS